MIAIFATSLADDEGRRPCGVLAKHRSGTFVLAGSDRFGRIRTRVEINDAVDRSLLHARGAPCRKKSLSRMDVQKTNDVFRRNRGSNRSVRCLPLPRSAMEHRLHILRRASLTTFSHHSTMNYVDCPLAEERLLRSCKASYRHRRRKCRVEHTTMAERQ